MKNKSKKYNEWVNIWTGRVYPPFLMSIVVQATIFDFKKKFSKSKITKGGNYWLKGVSSYFYLNKELSDTTGESVKRALKDPKWLYNFFELAFKKAKKLNEFSKKYPIDVLRNKDSQELVLFIEKFAKKFLDMYSYATLAIIIGYREDNRLYRKMHTILKQKTRDNPEKFANYLVILTNPPKTLKNNKEELKILQLAKQAKRLNLKTQQQIIKHFPKELKALEKEFGFLSFDLCDSAGGDVRHYTKLVKDKMQLDVQRKIREQKNYEQDTKNAFNRVCQELALSKSEKDIFNLIRYMGYYKWARQFEFQEALYNIKFTQEEIGKRCCLSVLESLYLLYTEYREAIKHAEKFRKIAKQRLKNCLIIVSKDKGIEILAGSRAGQKYQKMKFVSGKDIKIKASKLTGMPACAGKAQGIVKIVNIAKDLYKMQQGNILVSIATNPGLLSGMKKAAAIVTDEGGITCHAAIVSRELKKPCVIGTKIATKVLCDGQLVEVDANKGVVRIIK